MVFLIHAHFAVTTVLSNILSNIFLCKITDNNFQQNKLLMHPANLIDHIHLAYDQSEVHAKALPVTRFGSS